VSSGHSAGCAQIVATPRHRRRVAGCAGVRPRKLIRNAEDIDADAIIRVDYQNDSVIRIDETGVKLKRVVATGIAVKLSCAA
jgi:hypothetical protein